MKVNKLKAKNNQFRAEVEGLVFYVSDLEKSYYENWNETGKSLQKKKGNLTNLRLNILGYLVQQQ